MHGSEVPGEKGGNEAEVTFEEIKVEKKNPKQLSEHMFQKASEF